MSYYVIYKYITPAESWIQIW